MRYKYFTKIWLIIVFMVLTATPVKATSAIPAEWDFSLETFGSDNSWTSSTPVFTGYSQYEYILELTYVDFKVSILGWTDVLAYMNNTVDSGTANGLPFIMTDMSVDITEEIAGINYDIFSAHFVGGVDESGSGYADMTDVVLGNYLTYDVEGFRCGGYITVVPEPATVLLLGLGAFVVRPMYRRH